MNIINILSLSGLVFLSACSQQNSQNAAQVESTKKVAIAADNDKVESAKVDTGKASSEIEVEIPITITEAKIERKSKTLSYPDELIQQVKDAQKHCKQAVAVDMKDVVTVVDLIGDDQPEYIYEPDSIRCVEDGVFRGHGGDQLVIYQSKDHKTIQEIFNSAVFSYQIINNQAKAIVQVDVGGGYCGQNMAEISRAEAINCKRNLEWDESLKQLKMGKMYVDEPKANAE
ncbi:hypothetical protein [Acinetobacter sp. AS167]|uniref:hypothetical protein n=1 Tax=Acinetobacter sp. AS167 TaxID=3127884 RepID=UPI0030198AA6